MGTGCKRICFKLPSPTKWNPVKSTETWYIPTWRWLQVGIFELFRNKLEYWEKPFNFLKVQKVLPCFKKRRWHLKNSCRLHVHSHCMMEWIQWFWVFNIWSIHSLQFQIIVRWSTSRWLILRQCNSNWKLQYDNNTPATKFSKLFVTCMSLKKSRRTLKKVTSFACFILLFFVTFLWLFFMSELCDGLWTRKWLTYPVTNRPLFCGCVLGMLHFEQIKVIRILNVHPNAVGTVL